MAEAAASRFKGKQVEVEILTDTYKIRGPLFVRWRARTVTALGYRIF